MDDYTRMWLARGWRTSGFRLCVSRYDQLSLLMATESGLGEWIKFAAMDFVLKRARLVNDEQFGIMARMLHTTKGMTAEQIAIYQCLPVERVAGYLVAKEQEAAS